MSNIDLIATSLKCDNCDYSENVEKITENYINKPCPKCGENLLTQDDYDNQSFIMAMMKFVNKLHIPNKNNNPVKATITTHKNIEIIINEDEKV